MKKILLMVVMVAMMMPSMAQLASSGTIGTCDWTFDTTTGLLIIKNSAGVEQGEIKLDNAMVSPFFNNQEIKEILIEEGVFEIGTGAFMSCKSLKKITFPSTIGVIGFSTNPNALDMFWQLPFYGCSSLETLIFKSRYAPDTWNSIFDRSTTEEIWGLDPSKVNLFLYDESIKSFVEAGWGVFNIYSLPPVAEGKFGEDNAFSWKFSGNGKLTVSGEGAMPDFETVLDQPWREHVMDITELVVAEGITHIGERSFGLHGHLETAYLPATLTSIGDNAFTLTDKLTEITCAAIKVPKLGTDALPQIEEIGVRRYIYVWSYMKNDFETDTLWSYHKIVPFGAQQTWVFYTDVDVEPLSENMIFVTWPQVAGTVEYVVTITSEDGTVTYEITIDAKGDVTSYVKKALNRKPQYMLEENIDGFGLTINGLESGTKYNIAIVAKDETKALATYTTSVTTVSTNLETPDIESAHQSKFIRNGRMLIRRDNHIYNLQGVEE